MQLRLDATTPKIGRFSWNFDVENLMHIPCSDHRLTPDNYRLINRYHTYIMPLWLLVASLHIRKPHSNFIPIQNTSSWFSCDIVTNRSFDEYVNVLLQLALTHNHIWSVVWSALYVLIKFYQRKRKISGMNDLCCNTDYAWQQKRCKAWLVCKIEQHCAHTCTIISCFTCMNWLRWGAANANIHFEKPCRQ
jgi:hypothetical protein